jgi:hypothetical protein
VTVTQRPMRSPLKCGRVKRRPRSQGSRCSTRMAASSEPRSAQIECLTDQQAIDIAAHQTGDYETIEVWDGGRPVCRCGNSDKTGRADGRFAVRDSLASIA